MKILALDFSTTQRSVAVVQPQTGVGAVFQSERVEAGGRATRAFGLIEQALAEARLEREDIECVAVGLGPGSYTGIRAAIALAQGWQLARGVKLLGVGTVEVLAAQAQSEGLRGEVDLVVDAQRGEFYCSTWKLGDDQHEEAEPLHLVSREEMAARVAAGRRMLGPDLQRAIPQARALFPSAMCLGRLALRRSDFARGEHLVPVYLRETTFVKAPPPRKI